MSSGLLAHSVPHPYIPRAIPVLVRHPTPCSTSSLQDGSPLCSPSGSRICLRPRSTSTPSSEQRPSLAAKWAATCSSGRSEHLYTTQKCFLCVNICTLRTLSSYRALVLCCSKLAGVLYPASISSPEADAFYQRVCRSKSTGDNGTRFSRVATLSQMNSACRAKQVAVTARSSRRRMRRPFNLDQCRCVHLLIALALITIRLRCVTTDWDSNVLGI